MKESFKILRSDTITYPSFSVSFILILITSVVAVFNYRKLPPFVPIFTQLPWGEARTAPTYMIFLPTCIMFVLFLGNMWFASFMYKRVPLLARMLAITSFFLSLLVAIFTIRTIFLIV